MKLPQHPDADQTPSHHEPGTTTNWAGYLVIGIVAAVLIVIVTLHLSGIVGPAAH
jgi:hypothetical protein